jgi:Ca2+-binding RTX toxin-like protein
VLTGSGDDVITAYSDNDEIDSGDGNDTINAGAGSDTVRAGSGNDTITLLANDYETDVVSGGTGTDNLSIDFSANTTSYYGGLGWTGYDSSGNYTSFLYCGGSNIAAIQTALSNAVKLNVSAYSYGGVTFDGIENLNLTASDMAGYYDLFIVQGNGSYDGKGGTDAIYADWSSATSAITINNTDPTTAQDFNGSTITNIERWLVLTGSGDDVITAYSDNDEIDSGDGNDTINAGAGNDRIWGGIGVDTAIFSGMYSDYQIDTIIDGIKVTDLRDGGDGMDELYDIEYLQFSDIIVDFGNHAPILTTPTVINYTDTVFDDSFATIAKAV